MKSDENITKMKRQFQTYHINTAVNINNVFVGSSR